MKMVTGHGSASPIPPAPTHPPKRLPGRRPPPSTQHRNLHGGGGLWEINNEINFWSKQRNFDQVLALAQKVETEGLRPNIYTFHALLNAAIACRRGEAETLAVWQKMTQEHGLQPTVVTYNILLKRFFGRGTPAAQRQALAVLNEMRQGGVEPDVLTFNELINICVEGGDMKAASGLMQAMVHRGMAPDTRTYTTLIKGHGLKGNLMDAFETVKTMRARALPLSTYSCNVLADACIRCGQPSRALALFREFEAEADEAGGKAGRTLDLKSFNIMIKAYRGLGHVEGARTALHALTRRGFTADTVTYNTLVDLHCKAQDLGGARSLIEKMKGNAVPVTHQTIHPLVQEEIIARGVSWEEALDLAEALLGAHGLKENDVTICTVMEAMLSLERPRDAIQVFVRSFFAPREGMSPAEGVKGRERSEGGKEGMDRVPRPRVIPSLVAFNGLIKAYRDYVVGLDMEGEGGGMAPLPLLVFPPDGGSPLWTQATTPRAVLEAAVHLPSYLQTMAAVTPTATAPSPSSSSPHSGAPGAARRSPCTSHLFGGPDSITYNILMDFAGELGDVEALETIHAARNAAGFAIDHYVIHSYMKAHAVRGNLAGVTEAKEKMEALRVPANERTFSVLVLSLLRCGQVEKAELLLKNALARQTYVHDSLFVAFIQHYTSAPSSSQQPSAPEKPTPRLVAAREIFEAFKARRNLGAPMLATPQQSHGKWTGAVWSAWMAALARKGDLDGVLAAWKEMTLCPSLGVRPTRSTYAQVIRAACVAGEVETALQWVQKMREKKWVPDVRVYNGLIYACLEKEMGKADRKGSKGGGGQRLLVEVLEMMERDGVQPNAITLRAKEGVMRVLASRMRAVSDTMVGKLKMLALSKQWAEGTEGKG
ncbi:hypothetical protein NSK_005098 [Nannochloropsis salina CCMP1776]|uniref:Pentacotripeptide-repeat region of PRORP domain-containing protein n=1 Tax=Nannochloropsis salina CCMP1776 TaxID=1027361 RepID=A0A4D9D1X0_9STRA|nr:hypothetical protein NSK_005098 [Nannochloropsis salina CCMP1776]|eukprot:TFJ84003.1 hypothetical protein NSK_005098 [Nannochloropsis salina CCMP1776]